MCLGMKVRNWFHATLPRSFGCIEWWKGIMLALIESAGAQINRLSGGLRDAFQVVCVARLSGPRSWERRGWTGGWAVLGGLSPSLSRLHSHGLTGAPPQ